MNDLHQRLIANAKKKSKEDAIAARCKSVLEHVSMSDLNRWESRNGGIWAYHDMSIETIIEKFEKPYLDRLNQLKQAHITNTQKRKDNQYALALEYTSDLLKLISPK